MTAGHGVAHAERAAEQEDKVSRALAIQPLLAQGLVFAPRKSWADDLLLKEMSEFPLGKRDDLTDTTSVPTWIAS